MHTKSRTVHTARGAVHEDDIAALFMEADTVALKIIERPFPVYADAQLPAEDGRIVASSGGFPTVVIAKYHGFTRVIPSLRAVITWHSTDGSSGAVSRLFRERGYRVWEARDAEYCTVETVDEYAAWCLRTITNNPPALIPEVAGE